MKAVTLVFGLKTGPAIRMLGALIVVAAASLTVTAAYPRPAAPRADSAKGYVTQETRRALIRRAQVWTPTNVASLDLRAGPQDGRGFQPDELVACTYTPHRHEGNNPKFHCTLPNGDVVKVKYGRDNGEIYAEVLATRLQWALGFGADGQYPVRVLCRGCSSDPWERPEAVAGATMFEAAMIERPVLGRRIETHDASGWKWPELGLIDESEGGAPRAHRDALALLAVLLQHTDSKARQQRLVCLDQHAGQGGDARVRASDEGSPDCLRPFMYLHDVGLTFGKANAMNRNSVGSANFDKWARTPIWEEGGQCVGNLPKSMTGTLETPRISESGRAFLAALLEQLTDQQLRDLFEVAHVDRRSPAASVDDWVAAFKHKRDEIANRHCPA